MTDIRGYVLAGGLSSRMGSDKALLSVDEHTAIERQCELLESCCSQGVFIAGARSKELHGLRWPVVQDAHQDQGPLSGIVAALHHAEMNRQSTHGIALIIAVDLVALGQVDITGLISASTQDFYTESDVFFAHSQQDPSEHGAQPLCAAWRTETSLPVLSRQFADGQRSVMKAWLGLARQGVAIPEPHLININSPSDYENYRRAKG